MFSLILFFLINTQIITNIEAETKFTDSNLIIKTSGIKVGEQYSKYQIALAIQRLYQLKLFETIEVDTIHIADGVQVKFIVKEFPILQDVKFFGNRKIKTKDLIEKTKIKIGEVVTNQKIFDWKLAIQDLYKQKGYILIKVNVQKSEPDSTNRVSIIFQIDEGEKVRIKKIEIIGNSALSDKKIKKRMANKEKVWYRKGLFSEDKFKQDLDNIIELYKEHGFLDAQIVNYDIKFDEQDNNQWLDLIINIDEGQQYYIGDISFVGDSVIKSEELKSALRIKPNQVYNIKKINQTLVELYSIYSEQGFIYAQITPNEDIINNTVNIKYSIVENQPAKIRLVIIEGNERTHDKVIRRQISSLPGSIFKRSDVIRSQRDIFNLGFFEDVKLDYNRVNEQGDIDLIYQVKEKSSFGTIGAGISYSAQDKLTGYMELTQPNLFGKGQQLSIKAEKGGAKTNLQLGFVEPYLFDKPITGGINVSYLTRQYDYYEKKENAISLSFSRPLLLDYSRIHLGINISDVVVPSKSISANYKPTGIYSVYRDTTH
ncbi:MAG: outer membrane protein assembly factor BamA, partial [candidate division WOR-3 bacterium]